VDGIAAIEARIREITDRVGGVAAGGRLGSSSSTAAVNPTQFADLLSQAQAPAAPASTGELNRAGVEPVQWARDFLTRLGMPITSENVRAVTAWQQAEGTAARFNPLATTQGGFAGSTDFNSVGVKNFVSYEDGLAANVKVIQNGLYPNILEALRAGNSAEAVAQAIADSPWGSGELVLEILRSS
jgi:hypothetical protein